MTDEQTFKLQKVIELVTAILDDDLSQKAVIVHLAVAGDYIQDVKIELRGML